MQHVRLIPLDQTEQQPREALLEDLQDRRLQVELDRRLRGLIQLRSGFLRHQALSWWLMAGIGRLRRDPWLGPAPEARHPTVSLIWGAYEQRGDVQNSIPPLSSGTHIRIHHMCMNIRISNIFYVHSLYVVILCGFVVWGEFMCIHCVVEFYVHSLWWEFYLCV